MTGRFMLTFLFAAFLATAEARGQMLAFWPRDQDHVLSHEAKPTQLPRHLSRDTMRQLVDNYTKAQERPANDQGRYYLLDQRPKVTNQPPSTEEYDGPYIRLVSRADWERQERRTEAWKDKRDPKTTITSYNQEVAAWEEVSELSAAYVRNINGMNRSAQTLYFVLRAGNAEWDQVRKTGTETLKQSVERTSRAVKRAYFARECINKFRKWAEAAEARRRDLPYPIFDLSLRTSEQMDKAEFKDNKEILFVKLSELKAMRTSLEETPIVLPPKLDELTRYLDESVGVMTTALRTDELRATLAAEDVSRPAVLLGMDEYVRFYGAWREEQLRDWQVRNIPKYYEAFKLSPPASIAEEAKKLAQPFDPEGTHTITTSGTTEVSQSP